jgi:tyrosyl-tRNA synthetase
MSKSLGNTVGLTDAPADMYGRTMSIPDALLPSWIRMLGFGRWPDLEAEASRLESKAADPFATKQTLAAKLVERFHGSAAADDAAGSFRRVVQQREVPDEVPLARFMVSEGQSAGLLDVMRSALGLSSNSEARRLVVQRAVELDGRPVEDPTLHLGAGTYLIRAGRRRIARVEVRVER